MRAIFKREKAQALVEFVIAIPILCIVFFAALEMIHVAITHVVVKQAAYDAGRQAAIDHDPSGEATRIARKTCKHISAGHTEFVLETSNGRQVYTVIHHRKALIPIFPSRQIKHSVPVYVFHTGD